jgi:hypothetical protein
MNAEIANLKIVLLFPVYGLPLTALRDLRFTVHGLQFTGSRAEVAELADAHV